MIKLRQAQYCNLKLFLIFLVIYGHLIEARIWQSVILMTQYRWIYIIHMPLFSFLSGLFINQEKDCCVQLKRIFPLYLLLQTIMVLVGNGMIKPFTPWWHLWYLLSYCTWLVLTWIWYRIFNGKGKVFILILSIVIGCLAGFVPNIGREFSLSRTLVFFPYFWMGFLMKPSFHWKKLRIVGAIGFIFVLGIMYYIGNDIPVAFLYQATPYGNYEKDVSLRLICYLLAGLFGLFLLTIFPTRRFFFSKLGANTMPAYLIHAPITLFLRECDIPWVCHIIITSAFLYMMHIFTKWHDTLYGIISTEGGDTYQ